MTYDTKCYDLAEQFVLDHQLDRIYAHPLAQAIQSTIEDYIKEVTHAPTHQ